MGDCRMVWNTVAEAVALAALAALAVAPAAPGS